MLLLLFFVLGVEGEKPPIFGFADLLLRNPDGNSPNGSRNPKLFNMMPDLPSASTQRNLTLVAKVVQNMANMAEFGAKEPFMEVCNAHIQQQQAYTQRLLINMSTAGPQVGVATACG